jgi:hypothetical protein
MLYGIADCELHAFVQADEQKNVQEFYWVQFEAYIQPGRICTTNMIRRGTSR